MTSTPQDSKSHRSQIPPKNPRFLQTVLQRSPISQFRFLFFGSRVFLPVLGSALLGVAGTAFLLSEVVKQQAEEEIQVRLDSKVAAIDSALAQANTLAKAFRTSLLTLHVQEAKNPETYRKLTLQLFKSRPEAVTGLGFGQSQNGLLPDQQWLFAYFFLNSDDPNLGGQRLPAPDSNIRYEEGAQPGNRYADSDRYRNFFQPQSELWTLPYQSANGLQTSYYAPIFDDRNRWLGTVFVDTDSKVLQESLAGSVLEKGGFFALLTGEGQLVSAPSLPLQVRDASYSSIPDLDQVWQQMLLEESGLIEGKKGYWAYTRVPQTRWLAVAFVPYEAVFSQMNWIAIGGGVSVVGLLLLVLVLAMRSLSQRLRPLLEECDRLDAAAGTTSVVQDEMTQISASFFRLLQQLEQSEAQIQQHVARIHELEAQIQQGANVELEQKTLEAEVEHLFRVVDAVEQGDLLVAAQVGTQKTSTIADSLNRLIRRLGEMMGSLFSYSNEAVQDTQQIQQLAALVGDAAQEQTHAAERAHSLVRQINTIAQKSIVQAAETTQTVAEARTAIDKGQPEFSRMNEKVGALRQGTNQLVKRTQTLTSYVELTTQFAKDQKRIAAMTRVLAVNASMLASRAGGQQDPEQFAVITREFETIAEQVNQLAAQTNQSLVVLQQRSDQIQTVVSGLDYDLQAMSQQLNQFDTDIDRSRQLCDQAQFISDAVMQLGQQFTDSHQAIVSAAQTTLEAIHQISTIAATTEGRADLTQAQAQQIEQQVQRLMHQVEFFQLQPQPDAPRLIGAAGKNGNSDI